MWRLNISKNIFAFHAPPFQLNGGWRSLRGTPRFNRSSMELGRDGVPAAFASVAFHRYLTVLGKMVCGRAALKTRFSFEELFAVFQGFLSETSTLL